MTMTLKYEYRTMESTGPISEEQANELGEDGWQLQSAIPLAPDRVAWYFMRLKEAN